MAWKKCVECGNPYFDPQEKGGFYCSDRCNKRAYKKRRALNFINLVSPSKLIKIKGGKNV